MTSLGTELNKTSEKIRLQREIERIKKVEEKKEKILYQKGYKWVPISKTLKIFVPCSRTGKVTKEGIKRIEAFKQKLKESNSLAIEDFENEPKDRKIS